MKLHSLSKLKGLLSVKAVVILLVIIGLGTGGWYYYSGLQTAANMKNVQEQSSVMVERGEISVIISGTGTVEPIQRYDIVPLVSGNILSAPFEEGMEVKAGDLLYKIDESDLSFSIEKSKNNISSMELSSRSNLESIQNLVVYAPGDGRLSDFTVKEGDELSGGKIAMLTNDKKLKATISFTSSQIKSIREGQKAQLIVPQYMTYIDGSVTYINNTSKSGSNGEVLYDVEISIDNPGSVTSGMEVNGLVKGDSGDIISPVTGKIQNMEEQSVQAKQSGTVKKVYVKNGEWVKKGDKILEVENDSLYNTKQKNALDIQDAKLSLNSLEKQLSDYNITSPIDGKVITKNYKTGDTINSGNSSDDKTLMTVADMSKMIFTIGVDELDIAKVKLGQKVSVLADALPDKTFEGEITNIPSEGTSENGVTSYAVEVTIAEPDSLKPGMNVNAEIVVESKSDVLYVPISAVTKVGNKAYVNIGANDSQMQASKGTQKGKDAGGQNVKKAAVQRREVEIGINNDSYIEIVSGLEEGEFVVLPATAKETGTTTNAAQTNMMGGGMGMPGGGTGGPPSGGGGR